MELDGILELHSRRQLDGGVEIRVAQDLAESEDVAWVFFEVLQDVFHLFVSSRD